MSNLYMPSLDISDSGDRTSSESNSTYRSSSESNGNGKVKDKKNLINDRTNNDVIDEIIKKINEIYEIYKDYENTENNYNNPEHVSWDNKDKDNEDKDNDEIDEEINLEYIKAIQLKNNLEKVLIEKINTLKKYVQTHINENFIKEYSHDKVIFELLIIINITIRTLETIKNLKYKEPIIDDDKFIDSIDESIEILKLVEPLIINEQRKLNGGVRKRNKTRNIRKIRNSTKKNKKSRKIRKQRKNRRSKRSH